MINRQTIHENFNLFVDKLKGNQQAQEDEEGPDSDIVIQTPQPGQQTRQPSQQTQQQSQPGQQQPNQPNQQPGQQIQQPQTQQPNQPSQQTQQQSQPSQQPQTQQPSQQPQQQGQPNQQPQTQQPNQTRQPPPVQETRERNIYLAQIERDGRILYSKTARRLPVTDSPMQDALNVLLAGPTAEERNRGIVSLIPQNTKLLSSLVRGATAYLSFSEDFLFNTYGVEGYAAQVRQIVWTATEFSTVSDVQILIEGRRVDYLGEGVWIGSPLNRQSM